jgi:hypothetical protein
MKKREELEIRIRNAKSEQLRRENEKLNFEPQTNTRGFLRDRRTEDLLINFGKRKDEVLNF